MHNIDMTVTGGAFAAVREPGWHMLGVTVKENVKALELLRLAKGDFPILRGAARLDEMVPIDEAGEFTVRYEAVDSRNTLIYRVHPETGEAQVLGIASPGYPLWTPAQTLVGFGDAILGAGHMRSATAGVLDEGRQVFMSFELPEDIKLGGVDLVKMYLTVSTSFDQSAQTQATISGTRVVCANTLAVANKSAKRSLAFRKTSRADLQAKQAQGALELVPEYTKALTEEAEALLSVKITDAKFTEIVTDLWGPGDDASKRMATLWEARLTQLQDLFATADTQANVRGTGWAAVQAVTEHRDWYSKAKATDQAGRDAVRFARSVGLTPSVGILEPKIDITQRILALV
jgi:phage/plasmid-like protein (TIGR03299 family)